MRRAALLAPIDGNGRYRADRDALAVEDHGLVSPFAHRFHDCLFGLGPRRLEEGAPGEVHFVHGAIWLDHEFEEDRIRPVADVRLGEVGKGVLQLFHWTLWATTDGLGSRLIFPTLRPAAGALLFLIVLWTSARSRGHERKCREDQGESCFASQGIISLFVLQSGEQAHQRLSQKMVRKTAASVPWTTQSAAVIPQSLQRSISENSIASLDTAAGQMCPSFSPTCRVNVHPWLRV